MAELDAASAAFEALCVGCDLADLEELIAFAVDQLEEGAPPNLPAGVQRSIRRTVRARAFKAAGLVDPTLPAPAPAPAPSPAADDGGTIAAMKQLPEEARRELEKLMGGRPGQSAQLVNAHGIGASEPTQADPVPPAPPAGAAHAPSPPPPPPASWASAPHAVGAHPIPPAPVRAAAPPPLPPGAGHLGRASQVQGASKLSTASTEMQRVSQAAGVSRAGAVGSSLVGLAREARRVSTPAAGPDPEAGRLGDFELAGAAALLDQAIARRASAGVAGDLDQELAQMVAALRSGRY
jgi:hypothetical protein